MRPLPSSARRSKEFCPPTSPTATTSFGLDATLKASIFFPKFPAWISIAAWERRVETIIDAPTGLKANFISADDLITSKLASGRPQDLADADAIQQAQRLRTAKENITPEPNGPGR
jgi:hypothetical protein